MNKIQERLIKEVIEPTINSKPTSAQGNVVELYFPSMCADVLIEHPNGNGQHLLRYVPIQIGSGGVSQTGPFKGDKVLVTFKNSSIATPVVTAVLDTNFEQNSQGTRFQHGRKGSYVPDMITDRKDWTYSGDLYAGESSFDYLK